MVSESAGQVEEGSKLFGQGSADRRHDWRERWLAAELNRRKGQLLLQGDADAAEETMAKR
jgi:hypothetical protein